MTALEITGFIFGVAGVWLTIRENIWCFPAGLVNVIVSAFLFFDQKLYSDVLQQLVYIVLLSYGWINWRKKIYTTEQPTLLPEELPVSRSSPKMLFNCLLAIAALTYIMGTLFKWYTDASVPYWDALATSMSFTAQWLVAKKKIENWLMWMDVNILYTGIYIYKELYLYVILFAIYFILAVAGYYRWKKMLPVSDTHIN